METCKIKWVDEHGDETPDTNEAIGYVQREAYTQQYAAAYHGVIQYSTTEWFPICAEHAKQLTEPGMHHWIFRPIKQEEEK